jgi:hypothetical protein
VTNILDDFNSMTEDERDFTRRVDDGCGAEPLYDEEGKILRMNPERLGFIKTTGNYKWVVTGKYKKLMQLLALSIKEAHLFAELASIQAEKNIVMAASVGRNKNENIQILEPRAGATAPAVEVKLTNSGKPQEIKSTQISGDEIYLTISDEGK